MLTDESKFYFENVFSSKGRAKIIKLLAKKGELNITKITEITGLNHKNVKNHLKYLKKTNLIQEKCFGRVRIYRFKEENTLGKSLKNLILFWEEWYGYSNYN